MEDMMEEDCNNLDDNLHGCYLLYCKNLKYRGHTYIGYTVNPGRRIRQHNVGVKSGGAKRTSNRGPWEMALFIYGFLTSVSALQFEWAWQNPSKSRRLRDVVLRKSSKETAFQYRFRVVSQMLRTGPWKRMPLVVRWLNHEYAIEFNPLYRPPTHMPILYGPVFIQKVSKSIPTVEAAGDVLPNQQRMRCTVCLHDIDDPNSYVTCVHPGCSMRSHIVCLARKFIESATAKEEKDQLIPIDGQCPTCNEMVMWGDLIRHKNGGHQKSEPGH